MRPDRVWYLAYGSNVSETRFHRYLRGGPTESGARDTSSPRRSHWTTAPLRLSFANQSPRWHGCGVAFVDPDPVGTAIVRAWDITGEQFEDVFAQENRADVGATLDWKALAFGPIEAGRGWYRRVLPVEVPIGDGQPALTFTWAAPLPPNQPHPDYVETMRAGFSEHPDLDSVQIDAYLDDRLP